MANPDAAVAAIKARDALVDEKLEARRLKLTIASSIATATARAEGYGQVSAPRLSLMASQVSDAYNTKTRVDPNAVWNASFLPSKAELNVFPK